MPSALSFFSSRLSYADLIATGKNINLLNLQEDEKTRAAMARKREAEDAEAAKAEGREQSPREATNSKKTKAKSRHAAYRQSQDLSQSPGSFLRRLNGSRPQNGSPSKPRPNGKNGKSPGAPPSGNRPINPFQ